jgi:hypothetical protein
MHEDTSRLTEVEIRTLCLEIWVPPWAKFGSADVQALGGLIEAASQGRFWASRHVSFRGGMVEGNFNEWSTVLGIPSTEISDVVLSLIHLQFRNRDGKARPGQSWFFNT